MRHNGNKVSRKGIRVNWNKVQPKIVSSRGVRDSIVIGRESIFSVCEKSQQEQWKGPDKRNEIFLKNVSGEETFSGLISFRINGFDLLVHKTLKSLLQHHNSKASVLWSSTFPREGHGHAAQADPLL